MPLNTKNKVLIKNLVVICLMVAMGLLLFSAVYAKGGGTSSQTDDKTPAEKYGLKITAETSELIDAKAGSPNDIPTIIGYVVGALLSLLGVLFLIFIIYGGIMWMMAGGNAEIIKKAGAILRNAAIGLIIVIAAYAIVNYVLVQVLLPAATTATKS